MKTHEPSRFNVRFRRDRTTSGSEVKIDRTSLYRDLLPSNHSRIGAWCRSRQQLGSAPHRPDSATVDRRRIGFSPFARNLLGGTSLISILAYSNGPHLVIPARHFSSPERALLAD